MHLPASMVVVGRDREQAELAAISTIVAQDDTLTRHLRNTIPHRPTVQLPARRSRQLADLTCQPGTDTHVVSGDEERVITMTTTDARPNAIEALAGRIFSTGVGAAEMCTAYLGIHLGFYRPAAMLDLARRAGYAEGQILSGGWTCR